MAAIAPMANGKLLFPSSEGTGALLSEGAGVLFSEGPPGSSAGVEVLPGTKPAGSHLAYKSIGT